MNYVWSCRNFIFILPQNFFFFLYFSAFYSRVVWEKKISLSSGIAFSSLKKNKNLEGKVTLTIYFYWKVIFQPLLSLSLQTIQLIQNFSSISSSSSQDQKFSMSTENFAQEPPFLMQCVCFIHVVMYSKSHTESQLSYVE